MEKHYLQHLVEEQKQGIPRGICSICSANGLVIEAAMERELQGSDAILIEATSNQVNQFGGYTGMQPQDFGAFVATCAEKTGFPMERVILGGDHLGPNPWKKETAQQGMDKACQMMKGFILAGFTKIHLDASMALGGDTTNDHGAISPQLIAERGALLCKTAENAYQELLADDPTAPPPVYIIGTEVPVPGGSKDEEDTVQVTTAEDFRQTVTISQDAFIQQGLTEAWKRVIAVVVQPGVEFDNHAVHPYNREAAASLRDALEEYPGLVFEGHSTDYQTPDRLKQMVEDGIAILKVGPAVTFALREAIYALSIMEEQLLDKSSSCSNFMQVLDQVMLANPENWEPYYHGSKNERRLARIYSYSDRWRYYWNNANVQQAFGTLLENLRSLEIPLGMLSQHMPIQYQKVRTSALACTPEALLRDAVSNMLDDYTYATVPKIE